VSDADTTILNDVRGARPAREVFANGDPMTGQSAHLANIQIGVENTERRQQATFLLNYASRRVTSRGPSSGQARQSDIFEEPGLRLDFVAREAMPMFGRDLELSLEVRNILGQGYREYQSVGDRDIEINSYDLGTSFSIGVSLTF